MVVKERSSELCRRFARRVQSPSKAPSDTALTVDCHQRLHFKAAVAAFTASGIVRDVIHEFKYDRQIHLRHLVARWLRVALDDERLRDCQFDVMVPVPLHPGAATGTRFDRPACLRNY